MMSQYELLQINDYESRMAVREEEILIKNFICRGSGIPVLQGLGMGWPEQKDLVAMNDFAKESETIKLNERTTL